MTPIIPPHSGMIQESCELTFQTPGRGFVEITGTVVDRVQASHIRNGLCTLLLRHTSASLVIQENADPDVRRDFESFFGELVPDGNSGFIHVAEGEDDMPAHIRSALLGVNLSIPISSGRLVLGTWQGIYLWEHRTEPHRRHVFLHLLGER